MDSTFYVYGFDSHRWEGRPTTPPFAWSGSDEVIPGMDAWLKNLDLKELLSPCDFGLGEAKIITADIHALQVSVVYEKALFTYCFSWKIKFAKSNFPFVGSYDCRQWAAAGSLLCLSIEGELGGITLPACKQQCTPR